MTPLDHTERWSGSHAIITMPTEIDATNADELTQILLDLIRRRPQLLTLDLSNTTYCDSAGIRTLTVSHRDAEIIGCQLRLVVGHSPVRRLLRLTGLDQVMTIVTGE